MACNYPVRAFRIADRQGRPDGVVFAVTAGMNVIQEFKVPCGQCLGCKLERSRQWAMRCMHEASLYERNCFITLTYNEEHLPVNNSLDYREFQLFMKRLRKRYDRKIRFYMCGEYGSEGNRPHYHACLFNHFFEDQKYFKTTSTQSKLYTSEILDSLWSDKKGSIGYATIGEVTFESAAYVARYIMKKQNGHGSRKEYEEIDLETGEVTYREKEFNKMSLKPGIGKDWYEKWKSDVFPNDIVVVNGVACKPPKYYYLKLKEEDPEQYEEIQERRMLKAKKQANDNTDERLLVKEKVLRSKIKILEREIEK